MATEDPACPPHPLPCPAHAPFPPPPLLPSLFGTLCRCLPHVRPLPPAPCPCGRRQEAVYVAWVSLGFLFLSYLDPFLAQLKVALPTAREEQKTLT